MEKTETVFKKDTLRRHCLLRLTRLFLCKNNKMANGKATKCTKTTKVKKHV